MQIKHGSFASDRKWRGESLVSHPSPMLNAYWKPLGSTGLLAEVGMPK